MEVTAPLPTGTLTFLFTDLQGSVQLWERYPHAMPQALARHDVLLRRAIEASGGHVFKTVGDAFCAAFTKPPDAVAAALAAQQALNSESWGETGPLRVRMALHTGVAEERDGDYFGAPLNRVARLLEAGHGGQVLLSAATQELVRDHLPEGASLRDLGECRLKDLIRPERVFQLVHPDLAVEFPPLRGLGVGTNNLPVQPTPLVGREKEVATLGALLQRDTVRLLTLTGPGGTGKTRLALQVAADLLDGFEHGAFFVDLAPISDPALVASTIARTLGVPENGPQPLLESLQGFLRERQLLLVLDNFEQVLDAAPVVAQLLAAAPRLKALATSRALLQVRGEQEFPVPALTVPDPRHLPPPTALSQYAAVELFIQRALNVKPDFAVTNANAPAVAEICCRLDGLPLAIELAAARVRHSSPEGLLSRLGNRLKLLTGGARDLPARQQTLRSAIAWSYDLLDEAEQRLFRSLAVFVSGFTLEAAEAVCGVEEDADADVWDGVASLADKSLLRQVDGPEGASRYQMLETIREYAGEQLLATAEGEGLRQRHAYFYADLAERGEIELRGADQVAWFHRLEAEHDNLRAALLWSMETGEAQTGLRIGSALEWFWRIRGHMAEGRERLAGLLTLPAAATESALRSKALQTAAILTGMHGDQGTADALAGEALEIARRIGDRRLLGGALGVRGVVGAQDPETIRALFEECLAVRREIGDDWGASCTLNDLGGHARGQGDEERARAFFEESLAIRRSRRDKRGMVHTLANLGRLTAARAEYRQARALFQEALTLSRELGYQSSVVTMLHFLAWVARDLGDFAEARRLVEESFAVSWEAGFKWGTAVGLGILGDLARIEGDLDRATELHEQALAMHRERKDEGWIAGTLHDLGHVAAAQGDWERADRCFRESLTLNGIDGYRPRIAGCLAGLAAVALGHGRPERAARLLGAASVLHEPGNRGYPTSRAEFQRYLDAARAVLDAEAFAAAWAEGRANSLDEALAYALDVE